MWEDYGTALLAQAWSSWVHRLSCQYNISELSP